MVVVKLPIERGRQWGLSKVVEHKVRASVARATEQASQVVASDSLAPLFISRRRCCGLQLAAVESGDRALLVLVVQLQRQVAC